MKPEQRRRVVRAHVGARLGDHDRAGQVGEALQSLAFELLTRESVGAARVPLVASLAKAAGGDGMVLGQALDISAEVKTHTLLYASVAEPSGPGLEGLAWHPDGDLVFGIGYSDSIADAQRVLEETVAAHELVQDPDPAGAGLGEGAAALLEALAADVDADEVRRDAGAGELPEGSRARAPSPVRFARRGACGLDRPRP